MNGNNLNNSFILDLIGKNSYKKYLYNVTQRGGDVEKNKNRNFSVDYRRK